MPRTDPLCANCRDAREWHRNRMLNDGAWTYFASFGRCWVGMAIADKRLPCGCAKYKSPTLRVRQQASKRGAKAQERVAALVGGRVQSVSGGTRGDVRNALNLYEVKSRSAKWIDDAHDEALVAARGSGLTPMVALVTDRGVYAVTKIG